MKGDCDSPNNPPKSRGVLEENPRSRSAEKHIETWIRL